VYSWNLDSVGNWSNTTRTPVGGAATTEYRTHNKLHQVLAAVGLLSKTRLAATIGTSAGALSVAGAGLAIATQYYCDKQLEAIEGHYNRVSENLDIDAFLGNMLRAAQAEKEMARIAALINARLKVGICNGG
jgi:hypothetical protein